MNEKYKIVGYHGTKIENAKEIINSQKFIPGEDKDNEDFLGKGIYFFTKNEHAILWNLKLAKDQGNKHLAYDKYIKRYSVISADILVKRENVLDLEDIKDIIKYDKICKKFQKEFEKDEEYAQAEFKDKAIINYFYKKGYMDNIYAIRKIYKQKIRTRYLNLANSIEREIICVKNDKIISNINFVKQIDSNTYNSIKYILVY